MPTSTFDIVVLGDELSGLIAATLCASRGYRVALLAGESTPTSYKHGEFNLPIEPFAMIGLDSPAVNRAIDELHFTHLLRRKLRPTRIPFQLVLPSARIDVQGDDVVLLRELDRELAAGDRGFDRTREASTVGRGLDAVFGGEATVPATSFRAKREQAKLCASLEADAAGLLDAETTTLMRALWCAPAAISTRLWPDEQTALASLRAFDLWRQGAPRLEGNLGGLRELLLEKFESHGGEISNARPVELTYSWGKVTGVTTRGGDEFGASHLIAAMPVDELAVLVGRKGHKKLEGTLAEFEPAGYRYTLNIVVDESGVPEGMGETVIAISDPEKPLIGDNLLGIFVGEPDDRARVVVTVTATCPTPPDSSHLGAEFANLRVGLRESLESVMPFVGQHTLLVHSPHESLPAEGREAVKNGAIEKPIAPRPVWRRIGQESTEPLGALPYQIGLKNLTMATEQVLPGYGLEGQFAIALSSARLATTGIGKPKTPKGEVLVRG